MEKWKNYDFQPWKNVYTTKKKHRKNIKKMEKGWNGAWGSRANLKSPKPTTLQLPTTIDSKLLRMEVNTTFRVMTRRRHVPNVNRACMAHTVDLGEPFSRLIDWQLTNLMVELVVDGDHRKPLQRRFSLKKGKKKRKKNTKNEEGG